MVLPPWCQVVTSPARYGTETAFTYDDPSEPPEDGDFLVSSGGSAYLILAARRMVSRYRNRWWLRVARFDPTEVPEDAMVHRLVWYPRGRKR